MKTIDDIFGAYRATDDCMATGRPSRDGSSAMPHARSALDLTATTTTTNTTSTSTSTGSTNTGAAAPPALSASTREPTAVMLYGFGSEYQYAAIDFFEHASGGRIYEDYDRAPPHPRYSTALSGNGIPGSGARLPRTLSQAALRGVNAYRGGEHWIKVTFDSAGAAERACHASPHVICGYAVHAELFRGVGPDRDAPIPAMMAAEAKAVARRRQPPPRMQSTPSFAQSRRLNSSPAPSNITMASSATARTSGHDCTHDNERDHDSNHSLENSDTTLRRLTPPPAHQQQNHQQTPQQQVQRQQQQQPQKPLRIPTARRAVLLPASDALLPVPPWAARTFGHLPLIGGLLTNSSSGGGGAAVGYDAAIPRDEQGRVDWTRAGFWWRACWWVDRVFGTDVMGMRGDE